MALNIFPKLDIGAGQAITEPENNTLPVSSIFKKAKNAFDTVLSPLSTFARSAIDYSFNDKGNPADNEPLSIFKNTIRGLPKAGAEVGKDIAQGTVESFLSLGNTIEGKIFDDPNYARRSVPEELRPLLGTDVIRDLPTRYADLRDLIRFSPTAQKYGLDKAAPQLAFGGILGQSLLDYTPWGGSEKSVIKALTEATDEITVRGLLKQLGVSEPIAKKFALDIADTTDRAEVNNILQIIKANEGLAISAGEDLSRHAVSEDIPESLRSLAEEARKYGSAEEFADSHTPIYRADSKPFSRDLVKEDGFTPGTYFSKNREYAEEYGSASGRKVSEYALTSDAKVLKYEDLPDNLKKSATLNGDSVNESKRIYDYAKSKGYDAVESEIPTKANPRTEEFTVINPDKVKTREELTDLYNRATKGVEGDLTYEPTDEEAITRSLEQSAAANTVRIDPTIEEQFSRRETNKIATQNPLGVMSGEVKLDGVGAREIQEAAQRVKPPAAEIDKLANGSEGKSWQSLIKGFSKNLPKEKRVHLFDYLGTPEFVLEKIGLQRGAEMLQQAKDVYRVNKKQAIDKVINWKREVDHAGKPHSATRIFRYLDGDARYAKHEMNDTELRIAHEIKGYLKEWADRLKLPEDKRISNYITHIFDKDAVDLPTESAFDDPDLAVIMDSTPARSVYDPFLEKRVNKSGYREDVWAALDAYVKRATRKEAMDPALEALVDMSRQLDGKSYEYVTKLTHRINMRPTDADELLDNFLKDRFGKKFTDRPTAYLTKKIRNTFYRGTLGLNFTSALKNLSQGANTYSKLGNRYTVLGYTKLFGKMMTNNLDELFEHGILDESIDQDRKIGVYKTILQRADPYLFALFDMAEKINRGSAYFGAKSKGLSKGLSEEEAIQYAKRIVRETQFAFGAVDTPVALAGDLAKTAAQLGTYSVKQTEFLMRMYKNKEYAGLLRWSLASLAFVYSIGRIFGMKPEQLIPTYSVGDAPIFTIPGGIANMFTGFSQDEKEQGAKDAQRGILSTIPAGVQLKKTLQGLKAFGEGKDVTPSGKTRFKVEQTPGNFLRAVLFGKSSLPEAQDYYENLDNKDKKKSPMAPTAKISLAVDVLADPNKGQDPLYIKDTNLSAYKPSLLEKATNAFDTVASRVPFLDSKFEDAMRVDTEKEYPLTPTAKKILENVDIRDKSKKILAPFVASSDVDRHVAGTYQASSDNALITVTRKLAPILARISPRLAATAAGEHISLYKLRSDVLMHETLHAIYERSSIDPQEFLRDVDNADSPAVARAKKRINMDIYSGDSEEDNANELYAYIGQFAGEGGIDSIPPSLRKYYEPVFTTRD